MLVLLGDREGRESAPRGVCRAAGRRPREAALVGAQEPRVRASERARGSGPWCVVCARPAVERVRVRAERENRPPPAFELAARRARKFS